ncbi:hypothetical protein BJ741DRAFT_586744 [Chytriomyces cf. hyalinus JEL632]|nr:hypothetical protein BJ741DRAFT_586744 [Chytriomyces cf. hyalinus JEL632]
MLSGNPILLISDDEDDPLPAPSSVLTHTLKRPAPPSATQSAPKQIRSYAAIAAAPIPKPVVVKPKKVKPKTNKEKPHVLLWIPHNGLKQGQKNNWPSLKVIQKKIFIYLVYASSPYPSRCISDLCSFLNEGDWRVLDERSCRGKESAADEPARNIRTRRYLCGRNMER